MTARVTGENYEPMKGFCLWFWDQQSAHWDEIGIAPDDRPYAVLNSFEQRSMAVAREGVRQGIGDIIEETQHLDARDVASIDAELSAQGLPTLTEVRVQFWSKIAGIMKREKIRSETEYYALRNVVGGMPQPEQSQAWLLLGEFEVLKAG